MAYMDPYEEYMRSLSPSAASAPSTAYYSSPSAPTGGMSTLGKIGTGVNIASNVAGGAASIYATMKALEAAKEEQKRQRDREAKADFYAAQDRIERKRRTGRDEMFENAQYSGDFMDNLMNMYKSYNGGYFNLHG